jgi:hypothetical protein
MMKANTTTTSRGSVLRKGRQQGYELESFETAQNADHM